MVLFHCRISLAIIFAFHIRQNFRRVKVGIPEQSARYTIPLPVGICPVSTVIDFAFFRPRPELCIGKKHLLFPAFQTELAVKPEIFGQDIFHAAVKYRRTVGVFIYFHTQRNLSPLFYQIKLSNISPARRITQSVPVAPAVSTIINQRARVIFYALGNSPVGVICPRFQPCRRIFFINLRHDPDCDFMKTVGYIYIIKVFIVIKLATSGTFAPAGRGISHSEKPGNIFYRYGFVNIFNILLNEFLYLRIGYTDLFSADPLAILQRKILRVLIIEFCGHGSIKYAVAACRRCELRAAFLIKFFLKSPFIIPGRIDLKTLPNRRRLAVDRSFPRSRRMGQQPVTECRIPYCFHIIKLPMGNFGNVLKWIIRSCGAKPSYIHLFLQKSINSVKFSRTIFACNDQRIAATDDGKGIR